MTAYLRYMSRYYIRSYRYVAPSLMMVIGIAAVYADSSADVLSTYALGSVVVFLVSLWLAYSFTDAEHATQQQITVLHMGGLRRTLMAKLCFIDLAALVVAVYALIYPLLLHAFTKGVEIWGIMVGLANSLSCAWVGTAIGMLFSERFFARKSSAILLLFFVATVSLAGQSMINHLPHELGFLAWLLPPVSRIAMVFPKWSSMGGWMRSISLVWPLAYALIVKVVYVKLWERRLFV